MKKGNIHVKTLKFSPTIKTGIILETDQIELYQFCVIPSIGITTYTCCLLSFKNIKQTKQQTQTTVPGNFQPRPEKFIKIWMFQFHFFQTKSDLSSLYIRVHLQPPQKTDALDFIK